jgi:hypothetical protein
MPSLLHISDHKAEANCVPLSVVITLGTPNLKIQPAIRASAHVATSMFISGTASNQRVDLSIIVIMYLKPAADVGRGPTKSTCRWLNLLSGTGIACTATVACVVTLARWQCWQSRHHLVASVAIPRHTTHLDNNRFVARMPGWAKLCIRLNTACLSAAGINGLANHLKNHNIAGPPLLAQP